MRLFKHLRISNVIRSYGTYEENSSFCKKGYFQSPINICDYTTHKVKLPPLFYKNHFENDANFCLSQYENTVRIEPRLGLLPSVHGGPLCGKFFLEKIYFRWGTSDLDGSEHSIDGTRLAMEGQLIYYNSKFGCFQAALGQPNGVVMIGVIMETSREANNPDMDELIKCLSHLNCPGAMTDLPKNPLQIFRGVLDSQEYYSYDGSLTMPPCTEDVLWIVFKNPLDINCYHVIPFRNVCDQSGNIISRNCRNLQMLNGRTIYSVKPLPPPDNIEKKRLPKCNLSKQGKS